MASVDQRNDAAAPPPATPGSEAALSLTLPLAFARPFGWLELLSLVTTLLFALGNVAMPMLYQKLIDRSLPERDLGALFRDGALLAGILVVQCALLLSRASALSR